MCNDSLVGYVNLLIKNNITNTWKIVSSNCLHNLAESFLFTALYHLCLRLSLCWTGIPFFSFPSSHVEAAI